MKHASPSSLTAAPGAIALRGRALAKQQTRQRVLAAARRLFAERGYSAATVRDIAAAAGMSTGAVFANFTGKPELFREIVSEDWRSLLAEMEAAARSGKNLEDALERAYSAGYKFYNSRRPLVQALMIVAWHAEDGPAVRALPAVQAVKTFFATLLSDAAATGEVSDKVEVKLRSEMLFSFFLANFAAALFENYGPEALRQRARDQIRLVLAGAKRG